MPSSPTHLLLQRFRRSARGMVGLIIVALLASLAIAAPLLTRQGPLDQQLAERRQPPSLCHPLGLDELGRDNWSRIVHGARLSLAVGAAATALGLVAGAALGALAGLARGWTEAAIMGMVDATASFPSLLLALVIIAIVGVGLPGVTIAVGLAAAPVFARLMRIGVLSTRNQEHVVAAQAIGASRRRIFGLHILPTAASPLIVQAPLTVGTALLEIAALGFLGLGAQPPTPEWGAMIAQGRGALFAAPHIVIFPTLAIAIAVLGFNLLGDGLREALDPRLESQWRQ